MPSTDDFWARLIANLRAQGLVIDDEPGTANSKAKARHYLRHIGPFRFFGYLNAFKSHLAAGQRIELQDVLKLYKFDRRLRLLSLDALERVEVSIKAHLAHLFIKEYGDNWFTGSNSREAFGSNADLNYALATLGYAVYKRLKLEDMLSEGSDDEAGTKQNRPSHAGAKDRRRKKSRRPTRAELTQLMEQNRSLIFEAATFGDVSQIFSMLTDDFREKLAGAYGKRCRDPTLLRAEAVVDDAC